MFIDSFQRIIPPLSFMLLWCWTYGRTILCLYFGILACDAGSRTDVLLEQPQNVTLSVSDTVTYRCSVANSYIIIWWVNNSDATYTVFRDRGFTVVNINSTSSILNVIGHAYNNNTLIHCVALEYHRNIWIKSDVVLLILQDDEPYNTTEYIWQSLQPRTTKMYLSSTFLQPTSMGTPDTTAETKNKYQEIIVLCSGIPFVSIGMLSLLVIFIVFIFRKQRKCRRVPKEEEEEGNNMELYLNPVYQYTTPITLKTNCSYEDSNPLHNHKNGSC